jgi:hypothetical protein
VPSFQVLPEIHFWVSAVFSESTNFRMNIRRSGQAVRGEKIRQYDRCWQCGCLRLNLDLDQILRLLSRSLGKITDSSMRN